MKLSTVDLRLFAAIADTGGITAAARKLGLTKSLVSRELAELEERLGMRLVQRTTRRVSLTETGELLAVYARRVVEEMDNAEAAIEATREMPRGDLKIAVPFSVLRYLLAPRLSEFRARYPEIRLALDASTRITNLVDEGFDVAIRIGELPESSLVARRLTVVPVVLAASPAYLAVRGAPKVPNDLIGHDIVNLKRELGAEIWTLASKAAVSARVAVTPKIAIHDPGLLIDVVCHGLGVAPVPLLYARQHFETGSLVHVLPDYHWASIPVHVVYPSRRMLAPKVRAFVEFAAEIIGPAVTSDRPRNGSSID